MGDKLIVLTIDSCKGCKDLKEHATGNIRICDINSNKECAEIADKAGIKYVPSVVMIDGDSFKECGIEKKGDKFYAICDGKEVEI